MMRAEIGFKIHGYNNLILEINFISCIGCIDRDKMLITHCDKLLPITINSPDKFFFRRSIDADSTASDIKITENYVWCGDTILEEVEMNFMIGIFIRRS